MSCSGNIGDLLIHSDSTFLTVFPLEELDRQVFSFCNISIEGGVGGVANSSRYPESPKNCRYPESRNVFDNEYPKVETLLPDEFMICVGSSLFNGCSLWLKVGVSLKVHGLSLILGSQETFDNHEEIILNII